MIRETIAEVEVKMTLDEMRQEEESWRIEREAAKKVAAWRRADKRLQAIRARIKEAESTLTPQEPTRMDKPRKWTVSIPVVTGISVTVEASTREEAIKKAEETPWQLKAVGRNVRIDGHATTRMDLAIAVTED